MATSGDLYNQMQGVMGQLAPLEGDLPTAPQYFKEGLNKAYNYGLPLMKEAAGLQAGAYTLPGQLMSQYDSTYGKDYTGPSAGARLNSILGRLGNQFALSDVASGLAEKQSGQIEDMANALTKQYELMIDGLRSKYNMMSPVWQALLQKEEAEKDRAMQLKIAGMRGSSGGSGGGYSMGNTGNGPFPLLSLGTVTNTTPTNTQTTGTPGASTPSIMAALNNPRTAPYTSPSANMSVDPNSKGGQLINVLKNSPLYRGQSRQ